MNFKSLSEEDKPREKFLKKGKASLANYELLAILLGSGNKETGVTELANTILSQCDYSWRKLSNLTIKELMSIKGIGEAKAIAISAVLEIARRKSLEEVPEKLKIQSSADVYSLLSPHLELLQVEEFWVIYLNQSNTVVHYERLFVGGISQSVVDLRIIFRNALQQYATGIIIAHNHPAGTSRASNEDKLITEKIKEACTLLQIRLLDHVIIAGKGYFSFSDEGLL